MCEVVHKVDMLMASELLMRHNRSCPVAQRPDAVGVEMLKLVSTIVLTLAGKASVTLR